MAFDGLDLHTPYRFLRMLRRFDHVLIFMVSIITGKEKFVMLYFFGRRVLITVLSLTFALSMVICYQSLQARADTMEDPANELKEADIRILQENIGWGEWIIDFLTKQSEQVQGLVSAEINTNGSTEQLRQELQPLTPGVFGAEVTLDKEINGIQIHASSSSKVITSPISK